MVAAAVVAVVELAAAAAAAGGADSGTLVSQGAAAEVPIVAWAALEPEPSVGYPAQLLEVELEVAEYPYSPYKHLCSEAHVDVAAVEEKTQISLSMGYKPFVAAAPVEAVLAVAVLDAAGTVVVAVAVAVVVAVVVAVAAATAVGGAGPGMAMLTLLVSQA